MVSPSSKPTNSKFKLYIRLWKLEYTFIIKVTHNYLKPLREAYMIYFFRIFKADPPITYKTIRGTYS